MAIHTNIILSKSFETFPKLSFQDLKNLWKTTINGNKLDLRIAYREEFCENFQNHQKFNDLKLDERMHDSSKYSKYIDCPFATEQEWLAAGSPMPNLSYNALDVGYLYI